MDYSRQKENILNCIKLRKDHPTAEEIHLTLRKEYPRISLGTVYRNLDKLVKEGSINRLKNYDGKDRFDKQNNHHYHAICIKCGEIEDIFADYFEEMDNKIISKGYHILSHELKFNMLCSKCK
ncbi:MAG: transcriptional repressor [Clostridia bacterium]|nr:transcriptional repressor [Clostridia bacterium]MDD4375995.1 transcriptional repressor [Clostridia bacterium]